MSTEHGLSSVSNERHVAANRHIARIYDEELGFNEWKIEPPHERLAKLMGWIDGQPGHDVTSSNVQNFVRGVGISIHVFVYSRMTQGQNRLEPCLSVAERGILNLVSP